MMTNAKQMLNTICSIAYEIYGGVYCVFNYFPVDFGDSACFVC